MDSSKHRKLSLMMALVYAVQGSFWPLLAVHLKDLGIHGRERGWIFATLAMGSFVLPLGVGQLVDRFLSIQHVMALIYAVGTVFLVVLGLGPTTAAGPLFLLFLGYWLITAPAFGLSTALALRHLERPGQEFGAVRLWGTVGWMVVGWLVSGLIACSGPRQPAQGVYEAFWVSAALSALLAGACLALPDTPPLDRSARAPWRETLEVVGRKEVAMFLIAAFGVSVTTPFVYQVIPAYLEGRGLPRTWLATAMSLGQVPEIAALAAIPWLLRRLGSKGTLAVGIGAWVVRYASLALDPPLWVALAGIPLHGVAIACFTVGGQIYLDARAPSHRRASAQALLMVLSSGLGCLVGSVLAGEVVGLVRGEHAAVFLVPCVINGSLLIYFCAGFRPDATAVGWTGAPNVCPSTNDAVRGSAIRVRNLVTESADG